MFLCLMLRESAAFHLDPPAETQAILAWRPAQAPWPREIRQRGGTRALDGHQESAADGEARESTRETVSVRRRVARTILARPLRAMPGQRQICRRCYRGRRLCGNHLFYPGSRERLRID